jgi:hypothetical protein
MRLVVAVLTLSIFAYCQAGLKRVSPDEASRHLIKKTLAGYPAEAHMARIQGDVVLEVNISESGTASVSRLIFGHPIRRKPDMIWRKTMLLDPSPSTRKTAGRENSMILLAGRLADGRLLIRHGCCQT